MMSDGLGTAEVDKAYIGRVQEIKDELGRLCFLKRQVVFDNRGRQECLGNLAKSAPSVG